jgi:tRNA nucleotidyltransferase (CCA-adding enzyme)
MSINFTVQPEALAVCQKLQSAGYRAVVVGGCVRDSILGREPNDWDVATNAMPEKVMQMFPNVFPSGIEHGTVTIVMGKELIEVTTFRSDGEYTDGRRPDGVKLGVTLENDLGRRDFTMNAIALDPVSGELIDPFAGRVDLEMGLIRCVGEAKDRFNEDGLRMLRALRFRATLGIELDDDTVEAIPLCLDALKGVSAERFRDELMKLLAAPTPSKGLIPAMNSGLLSAFIPELQLGVGHAQNKWHSFTVWQHTVVTVDNIAGDPLRRLGALLHDVGKPASAKPAYEEGMFSFHDHDEIGADIAKDIVARLKLTNAEQVRVVGMVEHHMFGYTPKTTDKALRRFIKRAGVELIPDLVALRVADIIGKGLGEDPEEKLNGIRERIWEVMADIASGKVAVSTNQLAINGRDVMVELGIKPGREVGVILKALLDKVMDDPQLNQREALLQLLPEVQC